MVTAVILPIGGETEGGRKDLLKGCVSAALRVETVASIQEESVFLGKWMFFWFR